MRKLKRFAVVLLILSALFSLYVLYVNRDTPDMTIRQKILKAVYPAWMKLTQLSGKNTAVLQNTSAVPAVDFYSLQATAADSTAFSFDVLRGKKVLIVNTASDCGYTQQYDALEKLYQQHKGSLEILAFPSNEFKQQEKGTDADILSFCRKNYGLTFPVMSKSSVLKTPGQHPVYQWLTDSAKNGWNNQAPVWNFSKYLVDVNGKLVGCFGPSVSPLGNEMLKAINQ